MPAYLDISFEQWLDLVFRHSQNDAADWKITEIFKAYKEKGERYCKYDPELIASFLYRMFTNPLELLSKYSMRQISEGLQYIISYSGFYYGVMDHPEVMYNLKINIIQSMYTVFAKLFASEEWRRNFGDGKKDNTCFMWFDIINTPVEGYELEYLKLLSKIIEIPTKNCQYSALHGLGSFIQDIERDRLRGIYEDNWTSEEENIYIQETKAANQKWVAIIDEFLRKNPSRKKSLKKFAKQAKRGKV